MNYYNEGSCDNGTMEIRRWNRLYVHSGPGREQEKKSRFSHCIFSIPRYIVNFIRNREALRGPNGGTNVD